MKTSIKQEKFDLTDINTRVNLTVVLIVVAFLLLYIVYRLVTG